MELNFNVTGAERKRLVSVISEIMDMKPQYLGAPTFAYAIGACTVNKNGIVTCDDTIDSESLTKALIADGFHAEQPGILTIEMPLDGFTSEKIDNLIKLVAAKAPLLKKALGVSDLPIGRPEDRLSFPWFNATEDTATIKAYTTLIVKICETAKSQQRITATEKPVENEKYAFRCFLLRLGFIGTEYKTERKILLENLSGNASYKTK